MARFVRAGERLINEDNIVEIKVSPARERIEIESAQEAAEWDYPRDNVVPARSLSVEVVTTATTSSFDDGGDYPEFKHTDFHPYVITLHGREAKALLAQLYIPSPNGHQPATVMAGVK